MDKRRKKSRWGCCCCFAFSRERDSSNNLLSLILATNKIEYIFLIGYYRNRVFFSSIAHFLIEKNLKVKPQLLTKKLEFSTFDWMENSNREHNKGKSNKLRRLERHKGERERETWISWINMLCLIFVKKKQQQIDFYVYIYFRFIKWISTLRCNNDFFVLDKSVNIYLVMYFTVHFIECRFMNYHCFQFSPDEMKDPFVSFLLKEPFGYVLSCELLQDLLSTRMII